MPSASLSVPPFLQRRAHTSASLTVFKQPIPDESRGNVTVSAISARCATTPKLHASTERFDCLRRL